MTSATDRLCDDDGYPTEEAINALLVWPWDDPDGFLARAELLWCGSGHVEHDGDQVRFITGGWSGCESVINAMQDNPLLWARVWLSSHRGGLYVLSAKRGTTERDRIADAEARGRAHGLLAARMYLLGAREEYERRRHPHPVSAWDDFDRGRWLGIVDTLDVLGRLDPARPVASDGTVFAEATDGPT